jgi:hypothetical protein
MDNAGILPAKYSQGEKSFRLPLFSPKITWDHRLERLRGMLNGAIDAVNRRQMVRINNRGEIIRFSKWCDFTDEVTIVPVNVFARSGNSYLVVLGVIERGHKNGTDNDHIWLIQDQAGNLVGIKERKFATLPAEYVERDDLYNILRGLTYQLCTKNPQCFRGDISIVDVGTFSHVYE